MDRVSLIDSEGNLYSTEPPIQTMHSIQDQNLDSSSPRNTRINRISGVEWCFWAISSDLEVQLYVHSRKNPISAVVATYENQVRGSLFKLGII